VFCLALQEITHAQSTLCDSSFALYRQDVLYEIDHYDGRVRWDPETRESYYMVMAYCPTEALVRFTDDSIPAIRADIFSGLARINTEDSILYSIFNKHRNDTAEFSSDRSSVVFFWPVNEHMQRILDAKADSILRMEDYKQRLEKLRAGMHVLMPGERRGMIAKDSLLTLDSLVCSLPGYRVVSFQFYAKKGIKSKGNQISKRMKRRIARLKPGDKVFFEDIRAEMPDKTLRPLAAISLTVRCSNLGIDGNL
jgi:hypothetical protein